MHQRYTARGRDARQHAYQFTVELGGGGFVLLGLVDVGVGGAVEHGGGARRDRRFDLRAVGHVELGQIEPDVAQAALIEQRPQRAPEHSTRTEDHIAHRLLS